MTHPIDSVLVDGQAVSKGGLRDFERQIYNAPSVAQVNANALPQTRMVVLSSSAGQAVYVLDPSDTSTAQDSASPPVCVVSLDGRRFKRVRDVTAQVDAAYVLALLGAAGGLPPSYLQDPGSARRLLARGDAAPPSFVGMTELCAWLDGHLGGADWRSAAVPYNPAKVVIRPKYYDGYLNRVVVTLDGRVRTCGHWDSFLTAPGSAVHRTTFAPVPFELGPGVAYPTITQVEQSYQAAYALDSLGRVWAWGTNNYGQLGDGTTTARRTARLIQFFVSNAMTVHEIVPSVDSEGSEVGCFFIASSSTVTRGVWYVGRNANGEAGCGNATAQSTPVRCGTLQNVTTLWAERQPTGAAVFAKVGSALYAWGVNNYGCLGLGSGNNTNRLTPQLHSLSNVTKVSSAALMTLFLLSDGTVRATGYNGFYGLGTGNTTSSDGALVTPSLPPNVVDVMVNPNDNYGYTCCHAIVSPSAGVRNLYGWGYNGSGQVGNGTTSTVTVPTLLSGIWQGSVNVMKCGGSGRGYHSTYIEAAGALYSCGYNSNCQLGIGTISAAQPTFAPVLTNGETLTSWGPFGLVNYYGLAIVTPNGMRVCGMGSSYGQLGTGFSVDEAALVPVNIPFG